MTHNPRYKPWMRSYFTEPCLLYPFVKDEYGNRSYGEAVEFLGNFGDPIGTSPGSPAGRDGVGARDTVSEMPMLFAEPNIPTTPRVQDRVVIVEDGRTFLIMHMHIFYDDRQEPHHYEFVLREKE